MTKHLKDIIFTNSSAKRRRCASFAPVGDMSLCDWDVKETILISQKNRNIITGQQLKVPKRAVRNFFLTLKSLHHFNGSHKKRPSCCGVVKVSHFVRLFSDAAKYR